MTSPDIVNFHESQLYPSAAQYYFGVYQLGKLHIVDSVFDVQRAYLVIGQLMEDQILKTVCLLANEYTHLIYDLNDNNPDIHVGTLCDVRTVQRPF